MIFNDWIIVDISGNKHQLTFEEYPKGVNINNLKISEEKNQNLAIGPLYLMQYLVMIMVKILKKDFTKLLFRESLKLVRRGKRRKGLF